MRSFSAWAILFFLSVCTSVQAAPLYGLYRGMVVNPSDPLLEGRLLVEIPDISPKAVWAMPCLPASPPPAQIPQPGTMVWIEFEKGDINRPVWIGWLPKPGQLAPGQNR